MTWWLPPGFLPCNFVGHSWLVVWGILLCPVCSAVLIVSPP